MGAEHDNFVFEISAANFGQGVVGHGIVIMKLHLQVDSHFEFFTLLDHSHEPVVIFRGKSDLSWNGRSIGRPNARGIRKRICASALGGWNGGGTHKQSASIPL